MRRGAEFPGMVSGIAAKEDEFVLRGACEAAQVVVSCWIISLVS